MTPIDGCKKVKKKRNKYSWLLRCCRKKVTKTGKKRCPNLKSPNPKNVIFLAKKRLKVEALYRHSLSRCVSNGVEISDFVDFASQLCQVLVSAQEEA